MSKSINEYTLQEIAGLIKADWLKVNYAAKPYLDAMFSLRGMNDMYFADGAYDIVLRFLCNAKTWKGDSARMIKKELTRRTTKATMN